MRNLARSKALFIRRLSKLELLKKANFSEDTRAKQFVKEVLLGIGHQQDVKQIEYFKQEKEIWHLLKAIDERFDDLVKIIMEELKPGSIRAEVITSWFVFDPSAYALTYEEDDHSKETCFTVYLATPLLGALYRGEVGFKDNADIASFIDSILLHELAHCFGSMNHGEVFQKTLKKLCKITQIELTV